MTTGSRSVVAPIGYLKADQQVEQNFLLLTNHKAVTTSAGFACLVRYKLINKKCTKALVLTIIFVALTALAWAIGASYAVYPAGVFTALSFIVLLKHLRVRRICSRELQIQRDIVKKIIEDVTAFVVRLRIGKELYIKNTFELEKKTIKVGKSGSMGKAIDDFLRKIRDKYDHEKANFSQLQLVLKLGMRCLRGIKGLDRALVENLKKECNRFVKPLDFFKITQREGTIGKSVNDFLVESVK